MTLDPLQAGLDPLQVSLDPLLASLDPLQAFCGAYPLVSMNNVSVGVLVGLRPDPGGVYSLPSALVASYPLGMHQSHGCGAANAAPSCPSISEYNETS